MAGINGIFLGLLNAIYSFVGDYGWSVVLFTLVVRMVLMPLDVKQKKQMRAMSRIQPMQAELQRKYGKDKDKYNQKLQELYKREKISPLSGCLPMLIQLPLMLLVFSAMRNLASEQIARMLLGILDSMPAFADGTTVRDALAAIQIDLSTVNLTAEQITAILDGVTSLGGLQREAIQALGSVALTSEQITAIAAKLSPEQAQLIFAQAQTFLGNITLTAEQAQTLASNIPFQSWLWIKNVFEPDSFMSTILPAAKAITLENKDILSSMQLGVVSGSGILTAGNLELVASFLKTPAYASIAGALGANDFIRIPLNLLFVHPTLTLPTSFAALVSSANGLFILPVFAAVSQFFMTKLTAGKQPETPAATDQPNPMNMNSGFMKWFFPLFSLWICAGYNAAFAIYWSAVNVIQIITTFFINRYFESKDRQAALVGGQSGSDQSGT